MYGEIQENLLSQLKCYFDHRSMKIKLIFSLRIFLRNFIKIKSILDKFFCKNKLLVSMHKHYSYNILSISNLRLG